MPKTHIALIKVITGACEPTLQNILAGYYLEDQLNFFEQAIIKAESYFQPYPHNETRFVITPEYFFSPDYFRCGPEPSNFQRCVLSNYEKKFVKIHMIGVSQRHPNITIIFDMIWAKGNPRPHEEHIETRNTTYVFLNGQQIISHHKDQDAGELLEEDKRRKYEMLPEFEGRTFTEKQKLKRKTNLQSQTISGLFIINGLYYGIDTCVDFGRIARELELLAPNINLYGMILISSSLNHREVSKDIIDNKDHSPYANARLFISVDGRPDIYDASEFDNILFSVNKIDSRTKKMENIAPSNIIDLTLPLNPALNAFCPSRADYPPKLYLYNVYE